MPRSHHKSSGSTSTIVFTYSLLKCVKYIEYQELMANNSVDRYFTTGILEKTNPDKDILGLVKQKE